MAGDWIKIEIDLPDKPKVIAIAARLDLDVDMVVGKLVRLWGWANRQTTDGNAPGVTQAFIDRRIGVTGFASAMEAVGWLRVTDTGILFGSFDEHNSQTAKTRALTAKRVADHKRKGNAQGNGANVSEALPREEKRREDKTNNKKRPATRCPDGFSITPEMADWARRKVPSIDIESETEQFLDRQRATAGVYSDWTAAWRNWMRNAVKFQGTNRGGGGKHSGGKPNYSDKQNTHIREAMAGVGFTGPADYPDAVGVERRLQAPGAPRGGTGVDEGELETSSNQRAGPFPLSVL